MSQIPSKNQSQLVHQTKVFFFFPHFFYINILGKFNKSLAKLIEFTLEENIQLFPNFLSKNGKASLEKIHCIKHTSILRVTQNFF
jgi:hypothetical protein